MYYQHNGTIEKNNIIEAWEKVLTLLIHQGIDYNLILDFIQAHFIFKTFEIDEIVKFFYARVNVLHSKRIAGIANAPHEAAIIKLLETLKGKNDNFQIRVFMEIEETFKYLYLK